MSMKVNVNKCFVIFRFNKFYSNTELEPEQLLDSMAPDPGPSFGLKGQFGYIALSSYMDGDCCT